MNSSRNYRQVKEKKENNKTSVLNPIEGAMDSNLNFELFTCGGLPRKNIYQTWSKPAIGMKPLTKESNHRPEIAKRAFNS